MRQRSIYSIIFLTAGMFWAVAAAAAAAQNVPKNLEAYGEVYPAACKAVERKTLNTSLTALKVPAKQELWLAIETLLCAPGTTAEVRSVKQMLSSTVSTTEEATGSDPELRSRVPTFELAKELMANGKAWRATIESRDDGLVLQYAPNEACISSVTFVYRSKKWLISRTGSACD